MIFRGVSFSTASASTSFLPSTGQARESTGPCSVAASGVHVAWPGGPSMSERESDGEEPTQQVNASGAGGGGRGIPLGGWVGGHGPHAAGGIGKRGE